MQLANAGLSPTVSGVQTTMGEVVVEIRIVELGAAQPPSAPCPSGVCCPSVDAARVSASRPVPLASEVGLPVAVVGAVASSRHSPCQEGSLQWGL